MNDGRFSAAHLQAITAGDGPLAIVAGPGCGKTTTLAGRIAFLVDDRGLDPSAILMVTFTTEAARRVRNEVARHLGARAAEVSILTLHALGRRVINTWASKLGYDERPVVLHQDEARALLGSTAEAMGWDLTTVPVAELADGVDRCRLQVDAELRESDPFEPQARAYEERLRRHGAIDFAAMLSLPLQLFERYEPALRVLQGAYACTMVDEVQDLVRTQWRLAELLAERHHNLVVAGDGRQSIFTWRGADPLALEHFVERHHEARVVSLDQSHRSTNHLVQVGNALLDLFAPDRLLWTDNPDGPLPRLHLAEDQHAEAHFATLQITALLDRGLLPHPGHAAIIFRTRAQADVLAAALREAGLPYQTSAHADLFATRVVGDTLAYLRLAANPGDRVALMRVVDRPPRGLATLAASMLEEPMSLDELPARAADLGLAAVAAAAGLVSIVYDLHAQFCGGLDPVALLDRALDRSGLRRWLEQHPDGVRRLRLLARLRGLLRQLDTSLDEWLDRVALGDLTSPDAEEAVRLSSVHSAKGREWRATWVIGLEEGLVPHYRAIAASQASVDDGALDEELRALYVALTRARERLCLSACVQRISGDRVEPRQPSRWLHALGPELL
ncbi:MAG TPA: ATP-dependent helicase, partial [Chloroflexota bacterium]|nr:ATP-dependent helicase [Chloroflexota bacterium]